MTTVGWPSGVVTSRSSIAMLMRGHAIAARAIVGQPAGPAELSSVWMHQRELGLSFSLFRAISATALALSCSGHVDLAQQFVASGNRIDESGTFDQMMRGPMSRSYRSELDALGFEEDPDAEVVSLDELLDHLRALA